MLTIDIPKQENLKRTESKQGSVGEFKTVGPYTLLLEHSLISISKWESKYCRPFLSTFKEKTTSEWAYYFRCMATNLNINHVAFNFLTQKDIQKIVEYIHAPMTATQFYERSEEKSREAQTSEMIYFNMLEHGIPSAYEKWHLNRLLALMRICNVKRGKQKKMSKSEIIAEQQRINKQNRKLLNTKG